MLSWNFLFSENFQTAMVAMSSWAWYSSMFHANLTPSLFHDYCNAYYTECFSSAGSWSLVATLVSDTCSTLYGTSGPKDYSSLVAFSHHIHCVTMQEVMSNHWNEHGKPAFDSLLQKVPCIFFVVLFIYGWKFWIKLILYLSIWHLYPVN